MRISVKVTWIAVAFTILSALVAMIVGIRGRNSDAKLPPPTAETLLTVTPLSASTLALVAALLAGMYVWGACLLWHQKRRWSVPRTLSFLLGCVLVFLVSSLGLNRYGDELLSVLIFQQITLMTVVPPLLIVGSPGRLLLRSTPHHGVGKMVLRVAHGGLRSRTARLALHPVVAILVAITLYPALYLTDFVSTIIVLSPGHELLLLVFLGAGIIAGVPLWSSDPLPRAPSYGARFADVIIEIQTHAIFGLILISVSTPLFSVFADPPLDWGVDPLRDQAIAGTLTWSYAELPLFIVLMITLVRWRNRDNRKARLRQPREDVELEQYNQYLASLDQNSDRP